MKRRHTTYCATVRAEKEIYWFQGGKLKAAKDVDYSGYFHSHKDFRTLKKLRSFFRFIADKFPNAEVWANRL